MSTTAKALALLLTASLAVACGSDDPKKAASDTPPTEAAATAAATAINLKQADLPTGFQGSPHDDSDDTDNAADAEFASCAGASAPTAGIVEKSSDDFDKGEQFQSQQASSEVDVVKDAAAAKADAKAYASAKAQDCLKTFLTKEIEKEAQGATFSALVVKELATPAAGTDGSFGYSVTSNISAAGVMLPVEFSLQGFVVKHTEVSLTTFSLSTPFPADVRSNLLAQLVDRAKTSAV